MADNKTEIWIELRPPAAIAQMFTFIALMIYVFNIVVQCTCVTFRPQFVRQLAYIFQTVRMFLLMAALLPCVLHGQVQSVMPDLTSNSFAGLVLLALLGNILASIGIRKFLECNKETLLCLWRLLPFTRPYNCPAANICCPLCSSNVKLYCQQTTGDPDSACSPCDPPPFCCPKPRPGRPRKRPTCPKPDPCCPSPACPKPCKPRRRKAGCVCQ
ncbi:hypothetical protein ElyMa_001356800 [Elysia marginata]|uniref:Uncharacterized protein n=1 Tax=Elysia marginata TaxID=1093978 RepID=A0AAV4INI6_9GAST|nr:hypothetical protein ElyMa_001356800 [Elysia marginata]